MKQTYNCLKYEKENLSWSTGRMTAITIEKEYIFISKYQDQRSSMEHTRQIINFSRTLHWTLLIFVFSFRFCSSECWKQPRRTLVRGRLQELGSRCVSAGEKGTYYPSPWSLYQGLSSRTDRYFAKCPPGPRDWKLQSKTHLFGQQVLVVSSWKIHNLISIATGLQ